MRKKSILPVVVCFLLSCMGCTEHRGGGTVISGTDSLYTWDHIRLSILEQPGYALALVDTAEMRHLADANYANWMRAQIYYNSTEMEDLDKARDYCLQVLDNENPVIDSLQRIKTTSLLVSILAKDPRHYAEAVSYAIEGARMAHHAEDPTNEASFYFDAGQIMEKLQRGSGIDYLDRSLDIYREAARSSVTPLPMLSSNLGNVARILAEQGDMARPIALLKERLQVIGRIEKEYVGAPAGWIDQQRAYTYSVLACCQQIAGDKAGARRSAAAFEQTQASKLPDHQADIMNYYAFAGNGERIQQIYDQLEPYYREKEDTISRRYAGLVNIYSTGMGHSGRYREAYQALDRYTTLLDSLEQRERHEETLRQAQLMKTREKELQLKDEAAKTSVYRILSISLAVILVVIAIALWRLWAAHRQLLRKNRELYDHFVREHQREERDMQRLAERPTQERSPNEQLFLRLTELMQKEQPYTNSELNREGLASLLATNHRYIDEAIRACSDSPSTNAFINSYRVDHAAHMLIETGEPVALIAEMSGFANRTSFNERFRERFKMTPSEFRRASKS